MCLDQVGAILEFQQIDRDDPAGYVFKILAESVRHYHHTNRYRVADIMCAAGVNMGAHP